MFGLCDQPLITRFFCDGVEASIKHSSVLFGKRSCVGYEGEVPLLDSIEGMNEEQQPLLNAITHCPACGTIE